MNYFQVRQQLRHIVRQALEEDLGTGDATEKCLRSSGQARFVLRARQSGVFCGSFVAKEVFRQANLRVSIKELSCDGDRFDPGDRLQEYEGPLCLTSIERIFLNIIQHLTAVSTETALWKKQIQGLSCHLLDTRKTTPGWRFLEKYAVKVGGGHNHRLGLYDAVMIKDNHLARAGSPQGQQLTLFIKDILSRARPLPVIVEVDTLDQCLAVAQAQPDIILLDNMSLESLRACSQEVRRLSLVRQPLLEASGGIQLDQIRAIAQTGVNRISVGALTQNPPRVDLGLDLE